MKNKSSPGDHNVLSLSSNTDDTNHKDQWRLLLKDAEYSSYSVVALSPCHKMVAFGNLRGKIKLQDASELEPIWLLIETKIVLTVKQQWQHKYAFFLHVMEGFCYYLIMIFYWNIFAKNPHPLMDGWIFWAAIIPLPWFPNLLETPF